MVVTQVYIQSFLGCFCLDSALQTEMCITWCSSTFWVCFL